jgi:hypothetical protein
VKLPVLRPTLPKDLRGQQNGQIASRLLRRIEPSGQLHHTAADAWRCLRALAGAERIILTQIGDYRTYDRQVALFLDRMRTFPDAKRDKQTTRKWDRKTWYLHNGAPVAVPGTSNHGWGLAIDCAIRTVGPKGSVTTITSKPKGAKRTGLAFLLDVAPSLGWSWELQSEPWHIRYVAGDTPTPRLAAWLADHPR